MQGVAGMSRQDENPKDLLHLPQGTDVATSMTGGARDPYVGRVLDGRYTVERILGEGGMGVVYFGRHKVIGKPVAIKILRAEMATRSVMVERFLNEARAASSIGSPHIVDISDFGELPDGATYLVMEFLDGQSLGQILMASGSLPTPRLIHLGKQIARGLAAAHARGIIHRDLKPDNVMVVQHGDESDFVKVLDFGIAKVATAETGRTRSGAVFGTPHYMAPEQVAGAAVDPRTDVYALGVILHQMASGTVPFHAESFMGILTQHLYKAPPPLRSLNPHISPGLEAIVLKALSKDAALRYASMEELGRDLEQLERGTTPTALVGFANSAPVDYFQAHGASVPHAPIPRVEGSAVPLAPPGAVPPAGGAYSLPSAPPPAGASRFASPAAGAVATLPSFGSVPPAALPSESLPPAGAVASPQGSLGSVLPAGEGLIAHGSISSPAVAEMPAKAAAVPTTLPFAASSTVPPAADYEKGPKRSLMRTAAVTGGLLLLVGSAIAVSFRPSSEKGTQPSGTTSASAGAYGSAPASVASTPPAVSLPTQAPPPPPVAESTNPPAKAESKAPVSGGKKTRSGGGVVPHPSPPPANSAPPLTAASSAPKTAPKAPPAAMACDPPKMRDPFDGTCH